MKNSRQNLYRRDPGKGAGRSKSKKKEIPQHWAERHFSAKGKARDKKSTDNLRKQRHFKNRGTQDVGIPEANENLNKHKSNMRKGGEERLKRTRVCAACVFRRGKLGKLSRISETGGMRKSREVRERGRTAW